MNKRPVWRTENGGVNVGMWVDDVGLTNSYGRHSE